MGLHFVRGFSAQLVVIGHGMSFFDLKPLPFIQSSAVLIFFILSGFVIPYSTFAKSQANPNYGFAAYFVDRFSRIYVGFVPGLVFVLGIDLVARQIFPSQYEYGGAFSLRTFLGNLLMLQDWPSWSGIGTPDRTSAFGISCFGSGRPFWTVAVEWWIYLAFGWIAFRWLRNNGSSSRFIFWIVCLLLLIVPVHNLIGGLGNGLTLSWLFGLCVYGLVSKSCFRIPEGVGFGLGAVFLGLALFRLYETRVAYDGVYAALLAFSLYFGLSALQISKLQVPRIASRAITEISDYSYTIYLIHYSILGFFAYLRGTMSDITLFFAGYLLSNVVAFGMYYLFERHYHAVARAIKAKLLLA